MNIEKHFEVKTGENKGFYIVTKAKHLVDDDTFNFMANNAQWGMLVYEYNRGFYNYHHINPNIEVVWTHSNFAGHEYNRQRYIANLRIMGCTQFN